MSTSETQPQPQAPVVTIPVDKLVQLTEDFITQCRGVTFNAENIAALVARAMMMVESATSVSGLEKKAWVIAALKKLVSSHTELDAVTQQEFILLIDTVVPGMIDFGVAAAKGAYDLVQKKCSWCCSA